MDEGARWITKKIDLQDGTSALFGPKMLACRTLAPQLSPWPLPAEAALQFQAWSCHGHKWLRNCWSPPNGVNWQHMCTCNVHL